MTRFDPFIDPFRHYSADLKRDLFRLYRCGLLAGYFSVFWQDPFPPHDPRVTKSIFIWGLVHESYTRPGGACFRTYLTIWPSRRVAKKHASRRTASRSMPQDAQPQDAQPQEQALRPQEQALRPQEQALRLLALGLLALNLASRLLALKLASRLLALGSWL